MRFPDNESHTSEVGISADPLIPRKVKYHRIYGTRQYQIRTHSAVGSDNLPANLCNASEEYE